MIKAEDFTRGPCSCPECKQAGVDEQIQYRDRVTGKWLHGYDLRKLQEAREKFWREFQAFKDRK